MATNAQALFRQGIEALKAGDKATARRLLSEAAERVPQNQDIWLWLSDAAENDDQRREYIEQALTIDPQSAAGRKAQRKLDRLSAAASAEHPTMPGSETPGEAPPFPGGVAQSETSSDTAPDFPPLSGDPAISDGPPLPGSTTWAGESSWHELPPWDEPEEDEESQADEEQSFWKKFFSSPWGWAALVAVVVFAFVLIWAIGLAILGDETEQTAVTAERVILRFKQAGLEAENPRPMTTDDYGLAPIVCQDNSMRFFIPSLGQNAGGRVFVCPSTEEVNQLKLFYEEQGQRNPDVRSWTFDNDRVLVQLNGGLPQEQARRYGEVLNELTTGEPVVTRPTLDDTVPTNTGAYPFPSPTVPTAEPEPLLPTPEPTLQQPTNPPIPPDDGEIVAPTLPRDTPVVVPTATNPPPPVVEPTPEPPTSTPESVAPPEPVVTATPEPIVFTNTGSQTIDPFSLPAPISRVVLEHNGEGFFRVSAIGVEDGEETLLVETEGPYTGEQLLTGATSYFLDIETDGSWNIQIEAVGTSDQPLDELAGTGDFVSEFFMPSRSGEVPYTFTHNGLNRFLVVLRCADGETIVLDAEEGLVNNDALVPFGEGPCLWEVEADGDWQIFPQDGSASLLHPLAYRQQE
jgi:hypothetical protein